MMDQDGGATARGSASRVRAVVTSVAALVAVGLQAPGGAAAQTPGAAVAQAPGGTGRTAEPVGAVQRVKGAAELHPVNGRQKLLAPGDRVFLQDRILTKSNGQALLQLRDGAVLTVGPDAEITVDSFVYDPNRSGGDAALSVLRGTFHFLSGRIAKMRPDGTRIKVPVGTIGVRGTVAAGEITGAAGQGLSLVLLDPHGYQGGAMVLTTAGGTATLVNALDGVDVRDGSQAPQASSWPQQRANQLLTRIGMQVAQAPAAPAPPPATGATSVPQDTDPMGPVRFSYSECRSIVDRLGRLDLNQNVQRPPPGVVPPPPGSSTDVSQRTMLRYGITMARQLFTSTERRVGIVTLRSQTVLLNDIQLSRQEADGLVRLCRDRFQM